MYQPASIVDSFTRVHLAPTNCTSFVTHVIIVMIVIFKDTGDTVLNREITLELLVLRKRSVDS